jgi:hypothetical protein
MNISKESKKTFDDYYQQLIGYKIVSYKLDDEYEDVEPFPTFILSHPKKATIKIDVSQDPEGNGGGFLFLEMLKKSEVAK